jgi:hypothetical protein
MAFGPDTGRLFEILRAAEERYAPGGILRRERLDAFMEIRTLALEDLNVHSLPPIPSWVELLRIRNLPLKTLPIIPSTVRWLSYDRMNLKGLTLDLPSSLTGIALYDLSDAVIPTLPKFLQSFTCWKWNVGDMEFPLFPDTIKYVTLRTNEPLSESLPWTRAHKSGEAYYYNLSDRNPAFTKAWNTYVTDVSKKRILERTKRLKEEIMMKAYHPSRVEKWLDIGGFDLLEMMF